MPCPWGLRNGDISINPRFELSQLPFSQIQIYPVLVRRLEKHACWFLSHVKLCISGLQVAVSWVIYSFISGGEVTLEHIQHFSSSFFYSIVQNLFLVKVIIISIHKSIILRNVVTCCLSQTVFNMILLNTKCRREICCLTSCSTGTIYLIDVTSFLMESDTLLLWLANSCQVGGSRGLTAKDFAARTMAQEPSMMARPDETIGSWAARAPTLILAGWLANSGEPANVHRLSTASSRGFVAAAQLSRFCSL